MYVLFEYLTVLGLMVLATMLLFAASVLLVALKQAITAIWRLAPKAAQPAMAQEMLRSL